MEISCLFAGEKDSMLSLRISLSFTSSLNISSNVKPTTDLWLNNSNILLLLWENCIDHVVAVVNVVVVIAIAILAKSLLICRMKLLWFFNILPLGELVSKLDSDCTGVSKFSCNKHSFVKF